MSYIGRGTDKISNIEILDNITFDGSSSYSITKSSVAFTPNSAQSLLISIDGVVQATNFSVSSSTIDFGVAVPSTSTCDFFLHYGVGLITTPADGTVSLDKLSATGTKDATTFLRGDNTFNTLPASGITMADQWRVTTGFTGSADPISSNWERNDTAPSLSYFGSQMTESSGVFTFPSTGIYHVFFSSTNKFNGDSSYVATWIKACTDGSSFNRIAGIFNHINGVGSTTYSGSNTEVIVDVTDTSNIKVQFEISNANASVETLASSTIDQVFAHFIRLGDT